jgi:Response regulator of the LytR/AlgR family
VRIAICEDEKVFSDQLVEYINEWGNANSVFVEIFIYNSAEEFLFIWSENENFEVLFLDIKMKTMTGIELAKMMRKTNKNIQIIFTTNMKEYVFAGYAVSAMQYLLKPISKKDCFICLNKVNEINNNKKYYIFNDLGKTVKMLITDIICFELSSHIATMYTLGEKYTFRKTIAQILEEVDDEAFIRCHKSYIINIAHVDSVSRKSVSIRDINNKINEAG